MLRYNGLFHVFFLHMASPYHPGAGIGHAISCNGVDWVEQPEVVTKSAGAEWLGSGTAWQTGAGFLMNFSELVDGVQTIFFAQSDDLFSWQRLDEPVLSVDSRWYNDTATGRWDCVATLFEGGTWTGYLTATPWRIGTHGSGIDYRSVGRLTSEDGLHWDPVAPPDFDWTGTPVSSFAREAEVGGVAKLGDRYWMMLCTIGYQGDIAGAYSFSAPTPEGPFAPADQHFRLLSSRRFQMSYFPRFLREGDALLVNHHSIARSGRRALAPLKEARLDGHGCMQLMYWTGNEALKGEPLPITDAWPGNEVRTTERKFTPVVLDGPHDAVVFEVDFTVRPDAAGFGGAGVDLDLVDGSCIVIATTTPQTHFIDLPADADNRVLSPLRIGDDIVETGIVAGRRHSMRLLVREDFMECYIDDALVQVYSMASAFSGSARLVAESSTTTFERVAAWSMKL